jgi:hypothetical protein
MGLQGAGTVLPTLDIDIELTRHDFFYLRRYGMPFAGSITLKIRFFSLLCRLCKSGAISLFIKSSLLHLF